MKKLFLMFSVACIVLSCSMPTLSPEYRADEAAYLYVLGGVAVAPDAPNIDQTLDDPDDGIHLRSILIADIDRGNIEISNWRRAKSTLPATHFENDEILHWSYLNHNTHIYKGRLYAGPASYNGDTQAVPADFVVWADIDPVTGELSEFSHSERLPDPPGSQRIGASAIVEINNRAYYYVLGGNTNEGQTAVISYAEIDKTTGAPGKWQITRTQLPSRDWFNGALTYQGGVLHSSGHGRTGQMAVDMVSPDKDGDITESWKTSSYSSDYSRRWDHIMLKAKIMGREYIYLIGGAAEGLFVTDRVDFGGIRHDGFGEWSQANPIPHARRRFSGASMGNLLILTGGTFEDSAYGTNEIILGTVAPDGTVNWKLSSQPMFQARTFHGTAIYIKP